MSSTARVAKSYTIESGVTEYIHQTKGKMSASQRVNELLTLAIEMERLSAFERQAQKFFSNPRNSDRESTRAFQEAAIRVQARD